MKKYLLNLFLALAFIFNFAATNSDVDETKPVTGSALVSSEIRNNFVALKDELEAQGYYSINLAGDSQTLQQLCTAIGSSTIATIVVSDNYTLTVETTITANITLKFVSAGKITLGAFNLIFSGNKPDAEPKQIFNVNGAGTVSGLSEAYPAWWGANTTPGTTDMTAEILAARNSLQGNEAGKVIFQPEIYLTDKITIDEAFGLTFEGALTLYPSDQEYGTTLASKTAGTALIEINSANTNITIKNMNLDGKNQVDAVIDFVNLAGTINDFMTFENLNFYNVKDGGSFVKSYILNSTYSENAGIVFRNINFQLNSALTPASQGTAIHMENYGAWGWVCDKCWFSGQSKVNSIYLVAGELHLIDSQFDNNSSASTYDIKMYSSGYLTVDNVRSQSDQPFLWINPKTISQGFTSEKPIIIRNLFHHDDPGAPSWSTPPSYSIIHDATNSLILDGMEGYGINITSTPVELSIKNARHYRDDTTVKYNNGLNMLSNGEFESATTGWSSRKSATLSVDANGYNGTNCLKVLNTGTTYGSAVQTLTTVVDSVYKVRAYFKIGTSTGGLVRASTTIDGGGELLDSGVLTNANWTLYEGTFTATGTTTYINLMSEDAAGWNLFDRVEVYLLADGSNATSTLGQGDNNYLLRGFSRDLDKEFSIRHDIAKGSFDIRAYDLGTGYLPIYLQASEIYKANSLTSQSEITTITDTIEIMDSQIKSMTTPIVLVPAPGADYVAEFVSAVMIYDHGTTGYAEPSAPDDMVIEYATGTDITAAIDATGFITEVTDEVRLILPSWTATTDLYAERNQAIRLLNTGGDYTCANTDGSMTVKITYRLHKLGL